jgi:L-rhamnose-H+ transport protein
MLTGLLLVLLAGLLQGSFLFPSKWLREWKWENYWLFFAASAYLISPWVLAIATVPDLWQLYQGLTWQVALPVILFGFGWGLGAVTFGIGVEALGLALGFSVIVGVATIAGTLIPLIRNMGDRVLPLQLGLTVVSLVLVLIGVVLCSVAGRWKQNSSDSSSKLDYRWGLFIAVASGLLSSCGSLGFEWGKPIYEPLTNSKSSLGSLASNALLPILTPPLFLCNAGSALYFLFRNKTWTFYRSPFFSANVGWCLLMGVLWLAGMALFGIGKDRMGVLGGSLGWAMMMSSMILAANVLGMLSGEWKEAPKKDFRLLWIGLGVLVLAVCLLGYTNTLSSQS